MPPNQDGWEMDLLRNGLLEANQVVVGLIIAALLALTVVYLIRRRRK